MGRLSKVIPTAVAAALALAGPTGAAAAEQNAYAAGVNFATPVIVVNQGDTLRFNNVDITGHTLTSTTPGLFDSGVVAGGSSAEVTGVDKLPQGTYQFVCGIHPWMHGVIQVVPPGTAPNNPPPPNPSNPPNPVDVLPHAAPVALSGGDWPFYGKDLANSRDGGSTGPSVTQAPFLKPVWSFQASGGDRNPGGIRWNRGRAGRRRQRVRA